MSSTKILTLLCIFVTEFACFEGCPSGWLSFQYNCYLIVHNSLQTWAGAQSYCRSHGASLVEVDNYLENQFLKEHLFPGHNYFTGLNDIAVEGVFQWVYSDNYVTFEDFAPGEPNSWHHDQDCVVFSSGAHFQWSDQSCTAKKSFICEI